MGVPAVREIFGSALDASEAALRALDYGPLVARRVVARFRRTRRGRCSPIRRRTAKR